VQNDQGLPPPPRAGSEYEDDLRVLATMMELFISRLPAASTTPHERYASTKGELAPTKEKLCDMSVAQNSNDPRQRGSRRRCSRPSCASPL